MTPFHSPSTEQKGFLSLGELKKKKNTDISQLYYSNWETPEDQNFILVAVQSDLKALKMSAANTENVKALQISLFFFHKLVQLDKHYKEVLFQHEPGLALGLCMHLEFRKQVTGLQNRFSDKFKF